jgi:hypothetical protein
VIDAVIRDLSNIGYLVEAKAPEGPYFEAAVIHHTDCGSRLLEDPELRHGFAQRAGYEDKELAALPATVPADTVRADVAKILDAPQVSTRTTVSGHVYDTATGLLETRCSTGPHRHLALPGRRENGPPSRYAAPGFQECANCGPSGFAAADRTRSRKSNSRATE